MKKAILFLMLIITATHLSRAITPIDTYKGCVTEFYRLLFFNGKVSSAQLNNVFLHESYNWEAEQLINDGASKMNKSQLSDLIEQHADKYESRLMQIMKKDKLLFIQNCSYETILNLIYKSKTIEEGDLLVTLFELKFPNGNIIYFDINTDTPKTIIDIWLPSGDKYIYDKNESFPDKLRRPAIINDKDGFTNIRKEANASSKIVGKFVANELFFFTPISGTSWWPVYKNSTTPMGYIYKSKITFYKDFPEAIKKKVTKIRTGC